MVAGEQVEQDRKGHEESVEKVTKKSKKKPKKVTSEIDVDEYTRGMINDKCVTLCLGLLGGLGLKFSDRYNAKWGMNDFSVDMCQCRTKGHRRGTIQGEFKHREHGTAAL